jgi:hypothetical protein
VSPDPTLGSARVRMQTYAKGLTEIAIEQGPTILTQKLYEDHAIGRIPLSEIDGDRYIRITP